MRETKTVLVMKFLMNLCRVSKYPWLALETKRATLGELFPHISCRVLERGWKYGILDEGMCSDGEVVGRIHF